jgi:hypothetical protein
MELPSLVDVIKLGGEFQLISHWQQSIFKKLPIQTIQPVQTASVAASKGVKALIQTSIKLFGIIKKPRLSLIRADFTTLDAAWNMAMGLSKI